MEKKLLNLNFHTFFEICAILSGIHFLAQFISLCIYSIRVAGMDIYGEVSGLQLIGNLIYSSLPTFFTFVTVLGITILYFKLVPKKEKPVIEEKELQEVAEEVIEKEVEETVEDTVEDSKAIPEYNIKMKKSELLEIANTLDIKIAKNSKKEDIIKALDSALNK